MANISLKVSKREIVGRKVKKLREQGVIPGNVFGKNMTPLPIQMDHIEFLKVLSSAGETSLVDLEIEGKIKPVLISDFQTDPVTDSLVHVDFHQVDLKEKVTAEVPVELVGESPAEKQGLGTVVQYLDELEVEALPAELPEKFEIDISVLDQVDASIFVRDVKLDKNKVEIQNDPELILVKVEPQREEEVEPVVADESLDENLKEGDDAHEKDDQTKDKTEASEAKPE